jgi:hypothetical protein
MVTTCYIRDFYNHINNELNLTHYKRIIMKLTDLITKMDNSKRFDGHFNHEILSYMPAIEALIRSLQTMSLEEFALLQAGIEPVDVTNYDKIEAEWDARVAQGEIEADAMAAFIEEM